MRSHAPVSSRGRPRDPAVDKAILDAAIDLLGEGGYAAMTVEAVAGRAGVARASIYRRYPGRLELLEAVFRHFVPPAPAPPDTGSVRGDLIVLMRDVTTSLGRSKWGQLVPAMLSASNSHPEVREALARFSNSKRSPALTVMRRGIQRGELRADADPELITDLLVGALIYRVLIRKERVGPLRVEQLVDTVLSGASTR